MRHRYQDGKPDVGQEPDYGHWMMDGLMGWWLLNEGGGAIAHDASAASKNGTWNGTGNRYAPGFDGVSAVFNGTNDYVATNVSMSSLAAFTISFRVKKNSGQLAYVTTNLSSYLNIVQAGFFSDGNLYVTPYGQFGFMTVAATAEEWTTVVYRFDGGQPTPALRNRVWLNGSEVSMTGSNSQVYTSSSAGQLDIGRRADVAFYTSGKIDDVRLFRTACHVSFPRELYLNPWAPFRTRRAVYAPIGQTNVVPWHLFQGVAC